LGALSFALRQNFSTETKRGGQRVEFFLFAPSSMWSDFELIAIARGMRKRRVSGLHPKSQRAALIKEQELKGSLERFVSRLRFCCKRK